MQCRALQITTPGPHLHPLERLRRQFPAMRVTADGLLFPLKTETPEEILARCVAERVHVTGSVIIYAASPSSPFAS